MKVIEKIKVDTRNQYVAYDYSFDNGYQYRVYENGCHWAKTAKGNTVQVKTLPKLAKLVSQWEDTQIQIKE